MSAVIGALLDVSASMQDSIGDGVDEEGGKWAHSIFRVADDLVHYDVSKSNRVFVVGVGAYYSEKPFDIITTIENCKTPEDEVNKIPTAYLNAFASPATIESIFQILEVNGAHTIRRWAEINTVSYATSEYIAMQILRKLRTDSEFTRKFVTKYLPLHCRSWGGGTGASALQSIYSSTVTPFRKATTGDVQQVIAKAFYKGISNHSVYSVKKVSKVLHGCTEEQDLTTERVRKLLQLVEPFIYGRTPLYSAINEAATLFHDLDQSYQKYQKLLFILSDGMPTDDGNVYSIQSQFKKENVTVVSCFISKSSRVEPRKLHSVPEENWEDGAKFLFDLSSFIPTSSVTRAIFIKNKWNIDITNNETRLFMHVNHPDNLKDVCNLARNAVCCQDSLSECLVSVKLDLYINDKNRSVKVYDQGEDGTCYAHASATVLHLAMHRILGRNGGYPTFEALRNEMIRRYGLHGANTLQVLREICPGYHLRCREVDMRGAMEAITEKRPVVAKFRLTEMEWNTFYEFFRLTPNGILTKRDLDIDRRRRGDKMFGHAVVLTSFNSKCLQLMNSWGETWADSGFFKVQNADVLRIEFIDVYWDEGDLSFDEKIYYKQHGIEVAETLMRSLRALQMAEFTCPKCNRPSNVDEFSGTLARVCCPRCEQEFSSYDGNGNLLALNIYLTSLSR
jgi:hypothetical protein